LNLNKIGKKKRRNQSTVNGLTSLQAIDETFSRPLRYGAEAMLRASVMRIVRVRLLEFSSKGQSVVVKSDGSI
jgi:precorrin-2 methylase